MGNILSGNGEREGQSNNPLTYTYSKSEKEDFISYGVWSALMEFSGGHH